MVLPCEYQRHLIQRSSFGCQSNKLQQESRGQNCPRASNSKMQFSISDTPRYWLLRSRPVTLRRCPSPLETVCTKICDSLNRLIQNWCCKLQLMLARGVHGCLVLVRQSQRWLIGVMRNGSTVRCPIAAQKWFYGLRNEGLNFSKFNRTTGFGQC